MSHADDLADGGLLLGGEVDQQAPRLDLDCGLGALGGRDQGLPVVLLQVTGVGRVADVDRRKALVFGDLASGLERAGGEFHALELADLYEGVLDCRPRLGIGDLTLIDGEDERRVGAAERRRVRLEEIDRLLRLGAWKGEVIAGALGGAGREREQHEHCDGGGEASLPM